MVELLTPGVFIQEVDFGPQPIEGVSTTTTGFVGETERGLDEGQPVLVTSFPDFQRKFGSFVSGAHLAYAVRGFFDNGGRRAFISRIVRSDAAHAQVEIVEGYDVALLDAVPMQTESPPEPLVLRVASVVGAQVGEQIRVIEKNGTDVGAFTITEINPTANTLTVTGVLTENLTPESHAVRYVDPIPSPAQRITIRARDRGDFGDQLRVRLTPIYIANATITGVGLAGEFFVSPLGQFKVGQTVELERVSDGGREYLEVVDIDGSTEKITVSPVPTGTFVVGDSVRITGWRLEVFQGATLVEVIDQISSDNAAPDGVQELVNTNSQWVRVVDVDAAFGIEAIELTATTTAFPLFEAGDPVQLLGGSDGSIPVGALEVIGSDTIPRSGLRAIESQQGISLIAAPGFTEKLVISEMIAQSERRMDRFAVFEVSEQNGVTLPSVTAALAERGNYNSRYGAMYYPWIQVLDPLTRTQIPIPPSGHVLGAYARTDNERGVFKAPANVVLRGIGGFTATVPDGEQDLLNPAGVNVLRRFDGLGDVIWGARTISAEGLWKYVPVRRLFIFLEQSIIRGTRFAVFEPNDLRLWARLRDAVVNFLTTQWRAGALFGARPEEAFFVKVDETTTTQDDRDNGRVNIIVGIAPVKPAEFIVFQIGQAPQSVIISEQS